MAVGHGSMKKVGSLLYVPPTECWLRPRKLEKIILKARSIALILREIRKNGIDCGA